MSPEAIILTINLVLLGFGYLWAYPNLPTKTWQAIMIRDAAISTGAVMLAGLLFAGKGISFSLILFDTNWLVFSILTMCVIETPLFAWFAQKHDIRFDDTDD